MGVGAEAVVGRDAIFVDDAEGAQLFMAWGRVPGNGASSQCCCAGSWVRCAYEGTEKECNDLSQSFTEFPRSSLRRGTILTEAMGMKH